NKGWRMAYPTKKDHKAAEQKSVVHADKNRSAALRASLYSRGQKYARPSEPIENRVGKDLDCCTRCRRAGTRNPICSRSGAPTDSQAVAPLASGAAAGCASRAGRLDPTTGPARSAP